MRILLNLVSIATGVNLLLLPPTSSLAGVSIGQAGVSAD